MTLLWVALVAAVVWAAVHLFAGPGRRHEPEPERPEEILARRLARGEIDADTYEALRGKLRART